ncbi:uncharacterized protein VTP21DRAFT_5250 [Calcarisporiella thermophila]|uniref:uncharacterized protein n=1 Tax=Calcarisporiella thermophila TaxID=911321 RepID=UPI003743324A
MIANSLTPDGRDLLTSKIFVEDTVCSLADESQLGIVMRSWQCLEHEHEDLDEENKGILRAELPKGHVIVSWLSGSAPQIIRESDLKVLDRSLMYSDIVKRHPQDSQSGTIIKVDVTVDLVNVLTGQEIRGVNTRRLRYSQDYAEGSYVIMDDWVGVIDEVYDLITLRFPDGAVCMVEETDFLDIDGAIHENSCFYPVRLPIGQEVYAAPVVLRSARWIKGSYDPSRHCKCVVVYTIPIRAIVRWLSCNQMKTRTRDYIEVEPDEEINCLEELKVFKSFAEHATFAIGDHVFFEKNDNSRSSATPDSENGSEEDDIDYDACMRVIGIQSKVDVEWQDLSIERGISSCELVPYLNVDDQDLWPYDYVVSKTIEHEADSKVDTKENNGQKFVNSERIGIVQSVNAKERTCRVKWLNEHKESGIEDKSEDLSLYEVAAHEDLQFRIGDKVLLTPLGAPLAVTQQLSSAANSATKNNQIVTDRKASRGHRRSIRWFGEIVEMKLDRPTVVVRFIDGETAEVSAGQIIVVEGEDENGAELVSVDQDEDDDEFDESGFDESDAESWETISNTEDDEKNLEYNEGVTDEDGDYKDDSNEESGEQSYEEEKSETEDMRLPVPPSFTDSSRVADSEDNIPQPLAPPIEVHENWTPFLVVEEAPADHHFLNIQNMSQIPAWIKRIRREHVIMNGSLPDGILVRAFADRLDLLRVLIVGPSNTPYEDAVFMFDFCFGANFPSEPPHAYFHSWTGGASRVNPNLYADGKVCLSLLNTWHGKDETELWSPRSSMLQLLISLQGLVLVREPYFNEAGYEKLYGQQESVQNSLLYNEKAYLLSLGFIEHVLSSAPRPFSEEIKHFYFSKGALKRVVERGLELVRCSELDERDNPGEVKGGKEFILSCVSRGALKLLRKRIESLRRYLQEDSS